ncbi:MAG: HlyD family efflux transporter periplasmic adaptor subunit [Chlamydiae bacterium]|nr:HlyD family efflux transporter periplasmic adaptor subunit [Chlamydiota bacterium]
MDRKYKALFAVLITFTSLLCMAFVSWWVFFRFYKSTRDSYVHGNPILITPQISSYVTSIHSDDTFLIEEGQILVKLETIDFETVYERTRAELANATRQTVLKFEAVREAYAELKAEKSILIKAQVDYEDRKAVVDSGAVSQEDFIAAESFYLATLSRIEMLKSKLKMAIAYVRGTTVETHPVVEAAKEAFIEASVNLERCVIRSPATGIVTLRSVQVGEAVNPKDSLMTVVPIEQMWVNANFKETQLSKIRIGQKVDMTADMYGYSVVYHGVVEGISGGTGAVFSLLPPQEATGNWIKIVQRLPVRITLDPKELREHPLRLGLTMETHVHVNDLDLPQNPQPRNEKPIYLTEVYSIQGEQGKKDAKEIIRQNNTLEELTEEELNLMCRDL